MAQHRSWLASPQHNLLSSPRNICIWVQRPWFQVGLLETTLWLSVWLAWPGPKRWYQWHFLSAVCSVGNIVFSTHTLQVSRHRYQAVFTFPTLALDISQHVQSAGYPSFCKDQKRKLLRHRHFCNEFAANNRPGDKEMTLFTNPAFRVLDIILLWFVLSSLGSFRSIQYSERCIHSISRVKMNWIPSPTALYLSLCLL